MSAHDGVVEEAVEFLVSYIVHERMSNCVTAKFPSMHARWSGVMPAWLTRSISAAVS
jgi:hypothetical protein